MLPTGLFDLIAAIDACDESARSLTSGLTDAQANWQPKGGTRWSIAQCLDHLARINEMYVGHFQAIVAAARRDGKGPFQGVHPTWLGRMFVRSLEPPPRQRLKAPTSVAPVSSIPIDVVLRDYLRSHDDYRRLVDACVAIDVNRVTGPNPFARAVRMRVATALLVIPAHDRRHLWQAQQVRLASGFPG